MALKRTLTKAEFDLLPDVLKGEYKEQADKSYKIDVDGDQTDALTTRLNIETAARTAAEGKVREFETAAQKTARELEEARIEQARVAGDLKTVEGSWQAKLNAQTETSNAQVKKYRDTLERNLVDGAVTQLASELNPKLATVWAPHIRSRIRADFEGDEGKTVILDKDGKPSAMTIADLKSEFLANPDFKSIIAVSQASGGRPTTTTTNPQPSDKSQDFASMSPQALAAHLDANNATE